MRVLQLQGGYAGQFMDMPYHIAMALIASGHACRPDEIPAIKGLRIEPEIEVAPVIPKAETVLPFSKKAGRSKKS